MGGWSVEEYDAAPADLTDEIVEAMQAEHDRYEEIRRGRKGGGSPPRAESPRIAKEATPAKPAEKVIAAEVDPHTGRKMVTKVKEDGTVVKHREIEDGERILWAFVGKTPKSFEGK